MSSNLGNTTEDAQTVLLEGVETQFIIQRSDGESLSKGVPLFLSGELISEGMVVDMINADGSTDYNASAQYYETDDLLTHGLTEVVIRCLIIPRVCSFIFCI